ncbi:MAG: response regulator [bacterium]
MSKARILAVDDQRYFRELIEGLLEEEGYLVRTCASGEEALHILQREDFDIVVTDLVMPGIDGAELVCRVKECLPEQDIVMVTGVVDVKTAVEAMKLGATDYVLKPFDRGTLTDSLDKILATRRLKDEHARLMEENLEFMGVLSLVERASGLHSTLSVAPLFGNPRSVGRVVGCRGSRPRAV